MKATPQRTRIWPTHTCTVCGKTVQLKSDGFLRKHNNLWDQTQRCPGPQTDYYSGLVKPTKLGRHSG